MALFSTHFLQTQIRWQTQHSSSELMVRQILSCITFSSVRRIWTSFIRHAPKVLQDYAGFRWGQQLGIRPSSHREFAGSRSRLLHRGGLLGRISTRLSITLGSLRSRSMTTCATSWEPIFHDDVLLAAPERPNDVSTVPGMM